MFRRYVSISAAVLALICLAEAPGQLYAQRGRGATPHVGRFTTPGFRQFTNARVSRFSPGFDRRFDRRFGGFSPGFNRLFDPRFGGFSPGLDRRFFDPRFGGFSPGFDRRFFNPFMR